MRPELLLGRLKSALVAAVGTAALCPGPDPGAAIRAVRSRPAGSIPLRRAALRCGRTTCGAKVSVGRSRPRSSRTGSAWRCANPGLRVGFAVPGNHGYVDAAGETYARTAALRGGSVRARRASASRHREWFGPSCCSRWPPQKNSTLCRGVRLRLEVASALHEARVEPGAGWSRSGMRNGGGWRRPAPTAPSNGWSPWEWELRLAAASPRRRHRRRRRPCSTRAWAELGTAVAEPAPDRPRACGPEA